MLSFNRILMVVFIAVALTGCGKSGKEVAVESTCKVLDADISGSYSGGCRNGLANGEGVAKGKDEYKGMFVDGKQHGKGTTTSHGDKYEGDYVDGKRQGKGTYTWPNGAKYVGDYMDDQKQGKGTFTEMDGSKYVGDWVNGKRHGKGTITLQDGSKQEGDFVDDNLVASQSSLLETLLTNKWTSLVANTCFGERGAYDIYVKNYGEHFSVRGSLPSKDAPVDAVFIEKDPNTVEMRMDIFARGVIAEKLNDENAIASRTNILFQRLANGQIQRTRTLTMIDWDSMMRGEKVYEQREHTVVIMKKCSD